MWTSALEAAVGPDWLLLARLAELPEQQKVQVMHGMIPHDTARDLLKSKQERSAMQVALVARHEEIPRRGVASYRTPHNQACQNLQPSVSKPWPEQEPAVAPEPTQAEMASFNALNILATIVPEGYQNRPAPPPPQKRSQSAQGRSRRFQGAAKSPRDELWCTLTATDRPVLAATSGRAAAARSHGRAALQPTVPLRSPEGSASPPVQEAAADSSTAPRRSPRTYGRLIHEVATTAAPAAAPATAPASAPAAAAAAALPTALPTARAARVAAAARTVAAIDAAITAAPNWPPLRQPPVPVYVAPPAPPPKLRRKNAEAYCRGVAASSAATFVAVDADKSGKLDLEELLSKLATAGDDVDSAEVEALLKRLDADEDGAITIEEWRAGHSGSGLPAWVEAAMRRGQLAPPTPPPAVAAAPSTEGAARAGHRPPPSPPLASWLSVLDEASTSGSELWSTAEGHVVRRVPADEDEPSPEA